MSGRAYAIDLYHDEPGEAAVATRTLDVYPTSPAVAIKVARAALDDYWQTATVDEGRFDFWTPEAGVVLRRWVTVNRGRRWYIGKDWTEAEVAR